VGVALLGGPDHDPAVLAALLASTFTVAAVSDRTGTRLLGPPLPASVHSAHDRRSAPMARGAIELTPAGLIVLGPDHPTTGGYPVVAVLREPAQDAFFALPPGSAVRFVVA
jgi:allophanate hydrolase subunit 2